MDILHSIDIEATPQQLYAALTTREGLAGWYTPQPKCEAKIGGLIELGFGNLTTLGFRIDELEPHRRITWSCVEAPPEWIGTYVRFDMTPNEDTTKLRFSHTGLPPGYEHFPTFNYLWGQYVRSLKLFAETG